MHSTPCTTQEPTPSPPSVRSANLSMQATAKGTTKVAKAPAGKTASSRAASPKPAAKETNTLSFLVKLQEQKLLSQVQLRGQL